MTIQEQKIENSISTDRRTAWKFRKRNEKMFYAFLENEAAHKNGFACDICGFKDPRALIMYKGKILCYNCYHILKLKNEAVIIMDKVMNEKDLKNISEFLSKNVSNDDSNDSTSNK
jgi:hypothetical protein